MGSGAVMHVVDDDALHVAYDVKWVVDRVRGSYGSASSPTGAEDIARDASVTGFNGAKAIVVHNKRGGVFRRIAPPIEGTPTPQFFQDDVE